MNDDGENDMQSELTENDLFWLHHMAPFGSCLADGCPPIVSLIERGLAQIDQEGWTTLTETGRAALERDKST